MKQSVYFALFVLLVASDPAPAAVTGQVVDAVDNTPLADARVRIQATSGEPTLTDANGQFTITAVPAGQFIVTAVVSYDPDRTINYITSFAQAGDGDTVVIALPRLPADDVAFPYDPGTSFNCASCHQAQHAEWQDSNHSNAGLNEWVLDLFSGTGTPGGGAGYVFRDTHDADDNGTCATCHAPIEDVQTPGGVFLDEVTMMAGLDGVTCLACHQMAHVNENVSALHHRGNTQYRFPDAPSTSLWVWGPLDDVSFSTMRASHQPGFSDPRFCASCHEYNNPDTDAPGQNTYTEWLASPFSQPGESFRSCQDCHMPAATQPGPIASFGGPSRPAEQRRSHRFTGATPTTLAGAIDLVIDAGQIGTELDVTALVTNAGAGHRFPTGISLRNALLVVEATVDGQTLAQSGGGVIPFYGSAQDSATDDDLAGQPGKGFARVLEGRINGEGPVVRPVLFIDAENVWSDTTIASGETDVSSYRFDLTGLPEDSVVEINARLLYRRAWRDTVVTKGWTTTPTGGPIEIEVDSALAEVVVSGIPDAQPAIPVPTLHLWAMLLLALVLGLIVFTVRRV
ncbi:MAG: carboxypeptidase regulatory-like domain-containing protein [Wenzhouxiangella sp.]